MDASVLCPFCKTAMPVAQADPRGKIDCSVCLHEFLLRGNRLTPWIDFEGLDMRTSEARAFTPASDTAPAASSHLPNNDSPDRQSTPATDERSISRNKPKKKTSWGLLAVVAVVVPVVFLVFFAGGVAIYSRMGKPREKHFRFGDMQAVDLFADDLDIDPFQPNLRADDLDRELHDYFKNLAKIFRNRQPDALAKEFDIRRSCDELAAQKIVPAHLLADKDGFVRGLRIGFAQSLNDQLLLLEFDEFEIKSIRNLGNNEAEVLVRETKTDDGTVVRIRYWVSKRTGSWKIYDLEDLDMNLRMTQTIGNVSKFVNVRDAEQFRTRFDHLKKALFAVGARNPDEAERLLRLCGPKEFPSTIESLRHVTLGCIKLQRNQPKESLADFERARRFNPSMAKLDFIEAVAYSQLNQYDKALELLNSYDAALGDDADVCRELGVAYRGLGRLPEALAQFRKSLDYFPKSSDVYFDFLQLLGPNDQRDDVGPRFAKIENPQLNFENMAQDCLNERDWLSLEPLAAAMAKIEPAMTSPDFYLALARVNMKKVDEAMPLIKRAMQREPNAGIKASYWDRYLQSMVAIGKANEAYGLSPDRKEAFRQIGGELQRSYRHEDLRKLIRVHEKSHPKDPTIALFRAILYVQDGEHEMAETLFADAVKQKVDGVLLGQAHMQRIVNRYRLGKGIYAYEELGPKDQAFTQLAQLAWTDRDAAFLEQLVNAQDDFNPLHDQMARTRYRASLLKNKGADAAKQFNAAFARLRDEQQRQAFQDGFLYDCVDVDLGMLAYRSTADKRHAFDRVASDLLSLGRRAEVKELIAEHAKTTPSDPMLDFYRAELLTDERAWDKAASHMAAAWKSANATERSRMQHRYYFVLNKAGQGLKALAEASDRDRAFVEVARQMIYAKQWADLDKLIKQYRPARRDDPETLLIEARAKVGAKNVDAGMALLKTACAKQPNQHVRRSYLMQVMQDLADQGLGMDGYRLADDKLAAFDSLALRFVGLKQFDHLELLVREHAKANPADPQLPRYRGDVAMHRGDYAKAEAEYRAAEQSPRDQWIAKMGIERARVKAGKALATYKEAADDSFAFVRLAETCVRENDAAQLKAILAAHRMNVPDDSNLVRWEIEERMLAKDYESAVALCAAAKHEKRRPGGQILGEIQVRALVKLTRFAEAEQLARESSKKQFSDRFVLLLALAGAGDVEKTLAEMEKSRVHFDELQRYYGDRDLGPLLRQESFARFRERYPEPPLDFGYDGERFDDFD